MTDQAEWEPVADEVLASISERIEKGLQSLTDDIYERLLYAVQDNLADDAKYNIGSRIDGVVRQAGNDRRRLHEMDVRTARLLGLAHRVAALNPDAGEIGAGMLAQLVADATIAIETAEK